LFVSLRFLWYFPKPIYSRFKDLEVSANEERELDELIEVLGNFNDFFRETWTDVFCFIAKYFLCKKIRRIFNKIN